ncbi:hypothetical protein M5D96_013880, partial [Drosophila gunungcola]
FTLSTLAICSISRLVRKAWQTKKAKGRKWKSVLNFDLCIIYIQVHKNQYSRKQI